MHGFVCVYVCVCIWGWVCMPWNTHQEQLCRISSLLYVNSEIRTFFFLRFICLLCTQYYACMYACTTEEGTRSHYRWLWVTIWLQGIELRTSGRAASALYLRAISPAQTEFLSGLLAKAFTHWTISLAHGRIISILPLEPITMFIKHYI